MEFRQFNNGGGRYDRGGASRWGGGVTTQMDDDRYTDQ